jgi:general stress protein CsbA
VQTHTQGTPENALGMRWQDWMNALLGLWLIAAPFLMAYDDSYMGLAGRNSWMAGAALIVVPMLGLVARMAWREWLVLALGVWLVAAPFVLGFAEETVAMWNTVMTGGVVVIAAIARLRAIGRRRLGA